MSTPSGTHRRERGVALVMALLVLLVVSLLAAVLMTSINVESKIAGHSLRSAQALNTAEAGVGEALARIRSGDIPNSLNPRMVSQIFLAASGSVPVLGTDSIALATAQPAGQWLPYSTAGKSSRVLTVQYKTDPGKTVIYKHDSTKNPAIQTSTGMPIFVVASTGTRGSESRQIVTEVMQKPFNVNVKAAVTSDCFTEFLGNTVVCGYNHAADTPVGAGDDGRTGVGGCNEDPGIQHWELGGGDLPAAWTTDRIKIVPGSEQYASTVPPTLEYQPGPFYAGPWEVLGMSQAEFFQWVGPPLSSEPANMNGVYYLDNNGTAQDKSGAFAYHGGSGSGFLYVDGDLTLNSTFDFRGLVYVEGNIKFNGSAWILGGIVAKGQAVFKVAGGSTILYSKDAIEQNIAKFGGNFVNLSWREVP